MGKLFSYDGGIIGFLNKVVDCVFLSVLWIIFSIPLVTMGAATSALYYTAYKVIRYDRSHVLKEFWRAFISNFKKATVVGIALLVFFTVIIQNVYLYAGGFFEGLISKPFLIFNVVFGGVVLMWALHVFPFLSRFENKLKRSLMNCVYFSIRHFVTTVFLLVLLIVAMIVLFLFPVAVVIVPALYMLLASFLLEPIYRRYMSEEDLRTENERNMKYYN